MRHDRRTPPRSGETLRSRKALPHTVPVFVGRVTLLLALEELDLAFMLLRGFTRIERSQISVLPGFRILLFRVQAILA
jgi:hypothetical protein